MHYNNTLIWGIIILSYLPEPNSSVIFHFCWGNYRYEKLPMRVFNIPDVFHENMSELFEGFDMVRVYIDALIVINKHNFSEYLKAPEIFPQKFAEVGSKVNVEGQLFGCTETK